jgi:hypothetical protein
MGAEMGQKIILPPRIYLLWPANYLKANDDSFIAGGASP